MDPRALVGGAAGTVEDAAKHAFRDTQLHAVVLELDPRLCSSAGGVPCAYVSLCVGERTFLTSIPVVSSKTWELSATAWGGGIAAVIPGRRLGRLHTEVSMGGRSSGGPGAGGRTSDLEDLALLLGAIGEREDDQLIELRDVDLHGGRLSTVTCPGEQLAGGPREMGGAPCRG